MNKPTLKWRPPLGAALAALGIFFAYSWGIAMEANAAESIAKGVIFSAEQSVQSAKAYPMLGIEAPYWTPSITDISHLESALPAYLAKSEATKKIARNLSSYRNQYLGYSDRGERWILVNSFCADHWKKDTSWKNDVVFVLDGGDCYFQVRYRVSTSSFARLEINGES